MRAGTAVVWSVGPDGADDGGTGQDEEDIPGQSLNYRRFPGHDMLFPVPSAGRSK